ncbi:hypothetical protein LTR08_005157 [Meristemomyces frigidus]|nr:hypothetical protein LTR08_005157 [Meristemomyces frigidus]
MNRNQRVHPVRGVCGSNSDASTKHVPAEVFDEAFDEGDEFASGGGGDDAAFPTSAEVSVPTIGEYVGAPAADDLTNTVAPPLSREASEPSAASAYGYVSPLVLIAEGGAVVGGPVYKARRARTVRITRRGQNPNLAYAAKEEDLEVQTVGRSSKQDEVEAELEKHRVEMKRLLGDEAGWLEDGPLVEQEAYWEEALCIPELSEET